ncbi:MAG: DUF922 domain-containing protein [Candidatus Bipolaricaulota bacterium]|nr:DUF922 domain-containing protein [Candidatus Bipolaricaulota bacterium]
MRRGALLLLPLALAGAVAPAATLSWSWEVRGAGPCTGSGSSLQCQLPEGAPVELVLTVAVSPAQGVSLAPVAVPAGWPIGPAVSGVGKVQAQYAFTPPTGTAGRQVEIVYRAWGDGIPPVDLRLSLVITRPIAPCTSPQPIRSGEARLPWSARPIAWSDFWAPPPPDRDPAAAAAIATALEYRLTAGVHQVGGTWQARVDSLETSAFMDRDRSWALPDARTPSALRHEQRHFDLAELYRRVLERSLRGLAVTGSTAEAALQNLLALAGEVFRAVSARHSAVQSRYDQETAHGRDAARQAEWDAQIAAWLQEGSPALP